MITRKAHVITVLAIFSLTLTLFMVRVTISSNPKSYDPWVDTNDDGAINVLDLIKVATCLGTYGTPINKTAVLLELQAEVENLNITVSNLQERLRVAEEKLDEVKMIRYSDTNEFIGQGSGAWNWTEIAAFTWTPTNATNNAILSICYYAEWKCTPPSSQSPAVGYLRIVVDGDPRDEGTVGTLLYSLKATNYTWTPTNTWNLGTTPMLNHTISVQVCPMGGTIYVRNFNSLLTVMDGLP